MFSNPAALACNFGHLFLNPRIQVFDINQKFLQIQIYDEKIISLIPRVFHRLISILDPTSLLVDIFLDTDSGLYQLLALGPEFFHVVLTRPNCKLELFVLLEFQLSSRDISRHVITVHTSYGLVYPTPAKTIEALFEIHLHFTHLNWQIGEGWKFARLIKNENLEMFACFFKTWAGLLDASKKTNRNGNFWFFFQWKHNLATVTSSDPKFAFRIISLYAYSSRNTWHRISSFSHGYYTRKKVGSSHIISRYVS